MTVEFVHTLQLYFCCSVKCVMKDIKHDTVVKICFFKLENGKTVYLRLVGWFVGWLVCV